MFSYIINGISILQSARRIGRRTSRKNSQAEIDDDDVNDSDEEEEEEIERDFEVH